MYAYQYLESLLTNIQMAEWHFHKAHEMQDTITLMEERMMYVYLFLAAESGEI